MNRKTLHNWFASSSNIPPVVVPEPPKVTQIPNLDPLTPTNESSNPPTDETTTPPSNESTIPPSNESTNNPIDESTNQPPTPSLLIQEFHPNQIFGDPADRIPIEDYGSIRRTCNFPIGCSDVSTLARLMVQSTKHATFPLVYRLIELTLILPVATSSVERIFSAMKIIKTDLRNKISDDWLNDLMVCYCEKRIFKSIHDDQIMIQFQKKSDRRAHLPREYNVIA